ncbi:MAG: hypothetical protein ABJB02_05080 [Dokdonella sp.]
MPAVAYDWQVEITPAGELFPALQLSQIARTAASAAGGGDGLVSVRIRGADIPAAVRLRIDTPGLRATAVVDATKTSGSDLLELHPRLDWDVEALRRLSNPRRQILHVTLESTGRPDESRSIDVRLHPLDDALYFVREGPDRVDLGWAFAGYVDPHAAVVDDILASARNLDPQFDADVHDDEADLRRVGAVWAALEQRGLRYADGSPALAQGPAIWSQRVRLLDDVWRDRRANCLDSSVLIAAVLERLGLHAFIVLIPTHAFVGYFRGGDRRDPVTLETTLLGLAPTGAGANFARARAAGSVRWRKVAARLDGRHGPDYALIDIVTARAYGIIPLVVGDDAPMQASGHARPRGKAVR